MIVICYVRGWSRIPAFTSCPSLVSFQCEYPHRFDTLCSIKQSTIPFVELRQIRLPNQDMDPGTVVKVEADSFDDLPKEYQSLFLDALDRLSPQVDPNARYKFDLLSAATVEGKAHEARETRINRQGPRPAVPPLPEYFAKALAHTIKKQLRPNASSSIRNLAMSDLNTQFCKPCRRIFDGNGSFVYTVSWLEKGLYYSHWDRRMLERSARKCPMCQLSYRSLGTASSSNREKIPGCYDFVEFIRAKDVYGLRFSYYEMSIGSKGLLPHTTASNLITLEAIEGR